MWSLVFGSSQAAPPQYTDKISFCLNGKEHNVSVGTEVSAETSLNSYLRDVANLTGTKFMCNEGGCGACVVAATAEHPVTKQRTTFAVNSCLTPVLACDGWEVTTVEGLGDRRSGYHRVQAALAHFNGTQCGFCSPGMVMNMYSLLEGDKAPSMAEVENAFGGNLCRCTGYRPILDAFKSLSVDASPQLKAACIDIEDLYKNCIKKNGTLACNKDETIQDKSNCLLKFPSDAKWVKARSIDDIFGIFAEIEDEPYKLVAGNTAEGVYRSREVAVYIDVRDVPELRSSSRTATELVLGGNVTLSEAMRALQEAAAAPGFAYLTALVDHLGKVATVPVRNVGTLAGNLALRKDNPGFTSDIFTILETVGAKLDIMDSSRSVTSITLTDFLLLSMKHRIILGIKLPTLSKEYHIRTFRISNRAQNSHAYVNAGFLFKFEDTKEWRVVDQPRIVYGGINPQFVHASNLETFLTGKRLLEGATLTAGLAELERQLIPDHVLPDASPEFRRGLALALFYKFILGLDLTKVRAVNRSGARELKRPAVSTAQQEFDTDEKLWPLNQPVPKVEALVQCAGEAEYVNDLPPLPGELHAAFVLTTLASGTLSTVDPELALAQPGVVAFFRHTDIEGPNTFTPKEYVFFYAEDEEIFCSGEVRYAGQAVGLVVAETREAALRAAKLVTLKYDKTSPPVLTMAEVIRAAEGRICEPDAHREHRTAEGDDSEKPDISAVKRVVKGEFEIGKQYHLHMETQCCQVVPTEEGYDVFCATQWMDQLQTVVASTLNIAAHKVRVVVRRLGGGFGAKITKPSQLAAACALAAKKLNRPVRLVMTMSDNMELVGKRSGARSEYEIGVNKIGKIETLKATLYQDSGMNFNESDFIMRLALENFPNCYLGSGWQVEGKKVRTDTASNIFFRAPGTLEGVAFIEEIMERIAYEMNLDPLAVRLANMPADSPLIKIIADIKRKADYERRKAAVKIFNESNRWKKRGISLVPMRFLLEYFANYSALVSVYQADGSVVVKHGGIEMGQGLNTKVAQVAAYTLKIPLEKVLVRPSDTVTAPNSIATGASISSELASYATMMACKELLRRLEPIRKTLKNPNWESLVKSAWQQGVDLTATYMYSKVKDTNLQDYSIYGVVVTEVEVDVLTGERQVLRVDLLEDVGQSLSPMVDVGQIEGAFVMGMGYWLSEELVYDPTTGRLLNTRTWNYKPPGAKDIPADFRVYFKKSARNSKGVLQSKATGEPPTVLSVSVYFAVQHALRSARRDAGVPGYYTSKTPATPEYVYLAAATSMLQFQL